MAMESTGLRLIEAARASVPVTLTEIAALEGARIPRILVETGWLHDHRRAGHASWESAAERVLAAGGLRLAQERVGASHWRPVPPVGDFELVRRHRDGQQDGAEWPFGERVATVNVVGVECVTTGLSRDQVLVLLALISARSSGGDIPGVVFSMSEMDERILGRLFASMDRRRRLPPIDIDVDTPEFDPNTGERDASTGIRWDQVIEEGLALGLPREQAEERAGRIAGEESLKLARAIDEALRQLGIVVSWTWANPRKGSIHGDVSAPEGLDSPYLAMAWRRIVERAVGEASARTKGSLPTERSPLVLAHVDLRSCTCMADPATRGKVWRPLGACKPGGPAKVPLDLTTGAVLPLPETWEAVPVPRELLVAEIEEVVRRQEQADIRALTTARARVTRPEGAVDGACREPHDPGDQGAMPELVARWPETARIWDEPVRSEGDERHCWEYRLICELLRRTAAEQLGLRLDRRLTGEDIARALAAVSDQALADAVMARPGTCSTTSRSHGERQLGRRIDKARESVRRNLERGSRIQIVRPPVVELIEPVAPDLAHLRQAEQTAKTAEAEAEALADRLTRAAVDASGAEAVEAGRRLERARTAVQAAVDAAAQASLEVLAVEDPSPWLVRGRDGRLRMDCFARWTATHRRADRLLGGAAPAAPASPPPPPPPIPGTEPLVAAVASMHPADRSRVALAVAMRCLDAGAGRDAVGRLMMSMGVRVETWAGACESEDRRRPEGGGKPARDRVTVGPSLRRVDLEAVARTDGALARALRVVAQAAGDGWTRRAGWDRAHRRAVRDFDAEHANADSAWAATRAHRDASVAELARLRPSEAARKAAEKAAAEAEENELALVGRLDRAAEEAERAKKKAAEKAAEAAKTEKCKRKAKTAAEKAEKAVAEAAEAVAASEAAGRALAEARTRLVMARAASRAASEAASQASREVRRARSRRDEAQAAVRVATAWRDKLRLVRDRVRGAAACGVVTDEMVCAVGHVTGAVRYACGPVWCQSCGVAHAIRVSARIFEVHADESRDLQLRALLATVAGRADVLAAARASVQMYAATASPEARRLCAETGMRSWPGDPDLVVAAADARARSVAAEAEAATGATVATEAEARREAARTAASQAGQGAARTLAVERLAPEDLARARRCLADARRGVADAEDGLAVARALVAEGGDDDARECAQAGVSTAAEVVAEGRAWVQELLDRPIGQAAVASEAAAAALAEAKRAASSRAAARRRALDARQAAERAEARLAWDRDHGPEVAATMVAARAEVAARGASAATDWVAVATDLWGPGRTVEALVARGVWTPAQLEAAVRAHPPHAHAEVLVPDGPAAELPARIEAAVGRLKVSWDEAIRRAGNAMAETATTARVVVAAIGESRACLHVYAPIEQIELLRAATGALEPERIDLAELAAQVEDHLRSYAWAVQLTLDRAPEAVIESPWVAAPRLRSTWVLGGRRCVWFRWPRTEELGSREAPEDRREHDGDGHDEGVCRQAVRTDSGLDIRCGLPVMGQSRDRATGEVVLQWPVAARPDRVSVLAAWDRRRRATWDAEDEARAQAQVPEMCGARPAAPDG